MHHRAWVLSGLACALLACSDEPAAPPVHEPFLLATPEDRAATLERLEREPYSAILTVIEQRAARDYQEPDPDVWDHGTIGRNNETAQANAVLAWLFDDRAAADKARDFLTRMPSDFETNTTADVNIRMPHVLIPACIAWDLLRPWLDEATAGDIRERITTINDAFFERYLETPITRQVWLGVSQNNHPIRTAAAIGFVAITFPDHALAPDWKNWALSELSYLLGSDGRYIQPDGGVSEGPFYYGFAFGPAVALAIAMKNAGEEAQHHAVDCRNRQDSDPWLVTDCVDGEAAHFANPLDSELFHASIDWSINLRMPIGWRAPIADGNYIASNGGALLTRYGGAAHTRWDFDDTPEETEELMTWGMDLSAHHLFHIDESVTAAPPPWRNRFLPEAGNAVFRSGWGSDDRWLLLMAENGAARKTLHDHVDGTSFTLSAYGEYLLVDPGYHKPNMLDNALTAHSPSHNLVLIDGQAAPDKGLLLEFGDADAFLVNTVDGDALAYAEAHQRYQESDIERAVTFVRQRYFLVTDRIATDHTAARRHAWRVGGNAGFDVGGVFSHSCSDAPVAGSCSARFERALGGVDVHLGSTAAGLSFEEPAHQALLPPHVGAFNRPRDVEDHGVVDGAVDALAPGFLAVLAPYQVGASGEHGPMSVTRLDAGSDAVAYWIETDQGSELAWLRGETAATTLVLPNGSVAESDAAWVVLAADASFALIARGQSLSLDGTPLVTSDGSPVTVIQ